MLNSSFTMPLYYSCERRTYCWLSMSEWMISLWEDPRYLSTSIMSYHSYMTKGLKSLTNISSDIWFIIWGNLKCWCKAWCERSCAWNTRWTSMLDFAFGHVIKSTNFQYKLLYGRKKNWWPHLLLECSPLMWWKRMFFVAHLSIKQKIIAVSSCCTNHSHVYCRTQYIFYHRYWL